jgi:LemA protein
MHSVEWIVILGIVLVLPICWMVSMINRFARLDLLTKESWANVDVALKRRHDLIPNLVEVTKGYAAYEQSTLEKLIESRNATQTALTPADLSDKENQFGRQLHRAVALAEAYPDLKASQGFRQLQQELVDTEDRIAAARRFYNGNVREFNVYLESFPSSLFSGGRRAKQFFEIEDPSERLVPAVGM